MFDCRDEGLLFTFMANEHETIIEEWKHNWRENGYGSLSLFAVEEGMQESTEGYILFLQCAIK